MSRYRDTPAYAEGFAAGYADRPKPSPCRHPKAVRYIRMTLSGQADLVWCPTCGALKDDFNGGRWRKPTH